MVAFLNQYWHVFASIGVLIATVFYMKAQLKDSRDDIKTLKEDMKDKVGRDDCSRAHATDETLRRETQSILIKLLEVGELRMKRMEESDIRFEGKLDDIKDTLNQHIVESKGVTP